MGDNPAPAIRCRNDEALSGATVVRQIGDDTTFHRGFGTTGTRVELVDMSETEWGGCPRCGATEMVSSVSLNPEDYDDVDIYCTNVACRHFFANFEVPRQLAIGQFDAVEIAQVQDAVEYDMHRIRAGHPSVWSNSAECPWCGTQHTVAIKRHSRLHNRAEDGSSCIVEVHCDECKENEPWVGGEA